MTGIATYPVLVIIGSILLTWIIGEIHKGNAKFQKYILLELKNDWRLVQADVYTMDIFAERLEELGDFMMADEETQGLLVQVLRATVR